ncbi:MAG TPA: sulfotransferase [Rhodobacteraceae bacterium]|nr:sulfotransferase [Paracoccaceae bacterium]
MVAQIDPQFIRARPGKLWPRLLAYAMFEGRPLTTRGRWVNPLVFAGYRLWATLPQRRPLESPTFILGLGRSGTTVLGTILALHRDVGYLNEPKALWHSALGNEDLIGSYASQPGRYRLKAEDASPVASRRLRRYYGAYLRLARCSRVVDKYPELVFRSEFLRQVFPHARKIVMVRNGIDTCQSIEKWSRAHATVHEDWWGANRQKWRLLVEEIVAPDSFFATALPAIRALERQVDMAAVEWMATMREIKRLDAASCKDTVFVRYEELVAKPRETLEGILGFCGLPDDPGMVDLGCAMLRPAMPYEPVRLHRALQPLFDETMINMGYHPGSDK